MSKLYVSNKDESVRMFENDFLEMFSKVHWSTPLWVFIPIIFYFVYRGIEVGMNINRFILIYIGGIVIWSITEYLLHRFIFHYHAKTEFGRKLFWTFHGVHHDYPQDSKRLVIPPSLSLPLASFFYFMFFYTVGHISVSPFFAGFITGYLFYDITHYAIHHFNFKGNIWKKLKDHHSIHHYKYDELGFGVSSPVWDFIFKTNYPEMKRKANSEMD